MLASRVLGLEIRVVCERKTVRLGGQRFCPVAAAGATSGKWFRIPHIAVKRKRAKGFLERAELALLVKNGSPERENVVRVNCIMKFRTFSPVIVGDRTLI